MTNIFKAVKGWGKAMLLSKPWNRPQREARERSLAVLGNGPSLADTLADGTSLLGCDVMAVNFAMLSPEIVALKPRWYVLADPVFFAPTEALAERVGELWSAIAAVDWEMTLLVPRGVQLAEATKGVKVERVNMVGAEGGRVVWPLYRSALAMPRPRNVLVPAIMCGIWLGYKEILLYGADHSWTRALTVDDNNVASGQQPHFYKDNDKEHQRVATVQSGVPLHAQLMSFAIAFKSYHDIAAWASHLGVKIVNATPGSFIDAFRRRI